MLPITTDSVYADTSEDPIQKNRDGESVKNPGETLVAKNPGARPARRLGYARVSMAQGQVTDRQEDALSEAGCDEIYVDRISGMTSSRPALDRLLDDAQAGDTLVVLSLDRLGRDTRQLLVWVDELRQRQIELRILQLGVDTATPAGRMVFSIVAALAEMERAILVQRVNEGLAAARARGRVGGRPPALSPAQRREVIKLRAEGRTAGEIAELFEVSARTVRRVR